MSGERTVVIVGRSEELDLALDALADLELVVRVIPTLTQAERVLLGVRPPRMGAILVGLDRDPSRGLALIRELRRRIELAGTPIAVWAPGAPERLLTEAYQAGATSGVLLSGANEDAIRLAQMIHYWAVANEPPMQKALA